ncbi:MAG TPA: hypothetical protein VMY87_11690 [Armatimonadota bacterium]|nr:hypothetical protein [Armatimonadota bacterium]
MAAPGPPVEAVGVLPGPEAVVAPPGPAVEAVVVPPGPAVEAVVALPGPEAVGGAEEEVSAAGVVLSAVALSLSSSRGAD